MIKEIRKAFGFYDPDQDRIRDAERIVSAFKTMLTVAHLSENKSASCNFARQEIAEYERKWK